MEHLMRIAYYLERMADSSKSFDEFAHYQNGLDVVAEIIYAND